MRPYSNKAVVAALLTLALFSLNENVFALNLDPQCTLTGNSEQLSLCLDCHAQGMDFFMATAAPPESMTDECAICHIDAEGFTTDNANFHHIEGMRKAQEQGSFINCLECHTFNGQQGAYYQVNEPFNCFLNCHTPSFTRDSEGYLTLLTGEMYRENGWDISGMAKGKMGEAHHYNYAPSDYGSGSCYKCHAFEWDPELNAQVTVPVPGSAGSPQDVDNIVIKVSPGLVHDVTPNGTLSLSAVQSEGDIKMVRWSINNQPISYETDFNYTFNWAAVGDTYVIKLEVFSWDSRYAKQNIVVNIR